jgi:hypothetical protein
VTLIRLGRESGLNGFWGRTLHTIERAGGPKLRSDLSPNAGAVDASLTNPGDSSAGSGAEGGTKKDERPATSRKGRQER